LEDPYPIYTALRESTPAHTFGSMVLVTRFDGVKEMLADRERYSSKMHISGSRAEEIVDSLPEHVAPLWRALASAEAKQLARSDGEQHDRLRRVMHRSFTPRTVAELEAMVQDHANELIDELERDGGGDFKQVTQDLAARVIVSILGTPQVDRAQMLEWAEVRGRFMGSSDERHVRDAHLALGQASMYLEETLLGGGCPHRGSGSEALVNVLLDAEQEGSLSHGEVIQNLLMLLAAGIDTTAILISTGLYELLRDREHWQFLCDDPDRLPQAIEELLRYVTPGQWLQRIARDAFDLYGVEVSAGQTVIGMAAAANRDPRVFDAPDSLILDRQNSHHLSLGFGYKFCLGASLVRLEALTMLRELIRRHPDVALAPAPEKVTWSGSPMLRALNALPIELTA